MVNKKTLDLLSRVDWIDMEKETLDLFYYDEHRTVLAEKPSRPPNTVKAGITNFFIGRNSYYLDSGMVSPNVIIGRYCSISHYVNIGGTHHQMDYLSTGFLNKDMTPDIHELTTYTTLGCDVWIGVNATILNGAKIGHGAVIGAGAVVKKEIPPYAIAVGVPARVIKYRFPDHIIQELLDLKWWTLDANTVHNLPRNNVERCIEKLKEIRQQQVG